MVMSSIKVFQGGSQEAIVGLRGEVAKDLK